MDKYKISIIGPEATGKSTLSNQLAKYYKTIWLPEYARSYVENLDRKYTYDDIVHIAKKQIELEKEYFSKVENYLFVDTELIITKIWFQFVYKKYPDWLDKEIIGNKADLYLLCFYDLPWIYDKTRENGGENRKILYNLYESELKSKHFTYFVVKGKGDERIESSISVIDIFFRNKHNTK